MLSNSGKMIKLVSKILFFVNAVVGVILSVVLYRVGQPIAELYEKEVLLGTCIFVLFVVLEILSWMAYIFINGYGELIEDTRTIRILLENKGLSNTHNKEMNYQDRSTTEVDESVFCNDGETSSEDNPRLCNECGTPVVDGARFCGNCGKPVQ